MDTSSAIEVLSALAQPSRLAAFRLIVASTPEGITAGDVARRVEAPQNTMSSHLGVLTRAGLIHAERRGRIMLYRADIDRVREIASFLVSDCCGGLPELCAPLIAEFEPCCNSLEKSNACC